MMDEGIAKEQALLFLSLRRRHRGKKCKSPKFGLDTFFVKGNNMENITSSAGTKNRRSRILF